MSTKHVKSCSNILNVTMQKEWKCSAWLWTTGRGKKAIGFSPATRWMLCFSSQKVVAQDCEKLKIFSRSVCKLLSWREKLVDWRSYWWRLSDAHHLRVHFYSCFKVTPFQILASKRICMNVEVFQNKARRKNQPKLHSRANEIACKGSEFRLEMHRKWMEPWPGPAACPVNFYQA